MKRDRFVRLAELVPRQAKAAQSSSFGVAVAGGLGDREGQLIVIDRGAVFAEARPGEAEISQGLALIPEIANRPSDL